MSIAVQEAPMRGGRPEMINNFSLNIATINGSAARRATAFCCARSSRWHPGRRQELVPSNIQACLPGT